ncbi:hypothetical protein THRCLA_02809 [Thraustotheca clavata]|uniref:FYVE-type domain-containing protein n=1 Tax=Thraustotheca clavata TaxID=74557 RepID=A0A1W0A413_9STRA|nr:hypothetical protein THRCLA_02809 [Thraustotheca clavata]
MDGERDAVVIDQELDVNGDNNNEVDPENPAEFVPRLAILHQLHASEDDAAKGGQLCQACKDGAIDTVKSLVLDGAPVCFMTTSGWTPLAFACFNGRIEVVVYLLEIGAAEYYKQLQQPSTARYTSEKRKPLQQNTPLHWACYKGHCQVVWSLIQWGFSIEDADSCGNRAAHLACSSGNIDIIEIVLANSPDLSAKNIYGNTPMDLTTDSMCRKLLSKMQTQLTCDHCHEPFTRNRRTSLCQQCHNVYCNAETCTTSVQIPWSATSKSMYSVRYCKECVQALTQVEDDLKQLLSVKRQAIINAMAPISALETELQTVATRISTPVPATPLPQTTGNSEPNKPTTPGSIPLTDALGGVEPPLQVVPEVIVPKDAAVKKIVELLIALESNTNDVEALQTAIAAAVEKKGNPLLIEEANATYKQLCAHIKLVQEIKNALATRPISTRSLIQPLRQAWYEARAEQVESALVQAAQRVIVLAESETSLYGSFMLCARIDVGSAQYANDFVRLNHCLTMVEDKGINDTLMRNACMLRDRLSSEMTLELALCNFEEKIDGITNQANYVFKDGKVVPTLLEALYLRNTTLTVAVDIATKVEENTPVAPVLLEKAKECLVKLKKDIKEEQKKEDERRRIAEEEALKAAKKGKKGKKGKK